MARTEYGGLSVCAVDRPARRSCRPPRCRRRRAPAARSPGRPDLHRLRACGAQFVDRRRASSPATRPARCRSMVSVTPGPVAATVPIRIDSAASRALAFSIAAWSLLPGRLQRRQRALQVGDLGVECGLALLQRVEQHQQVGRPGRLQRVAGLGLPDLGDDRDAEQRRTAARRAPRRRAATVPGVPRPRPRRAADRRSVAPARRAAVRGGLADRTRAVRRCPGVGRSSAHAPNSLRRSAAALPKMRMPSTTMIAVDSCVPTPSWSPT